MRDYEDRGLFHTTTTTDKVFANLIVISANEWSL